MKKITNKIIFIIITCASIISVASLTKTNAQEINRNDLTAYKTDMSSIENETNIRTASSSEETTWDVSENGDGSVTAKVIAVRGTTYAIKISGTGNIGNIYQRSSLNLCTIKIIVIGDGITGIGNNAFNGGSDIEFITTEEEENNITPGTLYNDFSNDTSKIPSSITSIGDNAFSGCKGLSNIEIPDSVTSIGNNAFENCNSNLSINAICSNTELINYAKRNNIQTNISHKYKYDSVDIDNKIVTYKCENCEETRTETFTESWDVSENQDNSVIAVLTTDGTLIISGTGNVRDKAIAYLQDDYIKSIKSIIIEKDITSVGKLAFVLCDHLKEINVDEDNKNYSSQDGILFNKTKTILISYPPEKQNETYEIANTISTIEDYAFIGNSSLTSITIPESITYIPDSAFNGCKSLKSIEIDNNNKNYSSENGVLLNKNKTELVRYLEGKEDITYETPNSVTSIGDYAFFYCSNLTSVAIQENVTTIGKGAFEQCTNLKNITIPEGVTSIKDYTFDDCSNLTSVEIPEGVTSIGDWAFAKCSSLVNITLPKSVISIGNNVFCDSSNLTISTPCNSEYVINYATENDKKLNMIHTYKLDSINYENKTITYKCTICQTMETKSFADAENVWDVSANGDWSVIAMLTKDGTLTISGTGNMKNYTSSAMVPYYNNKENIKSAIIEEGVTSIGDYAFFTYRNLTSVTIPSSVRSIEKVPFFECGSLTSIVVDNDNQNYCSENGVLFNKEKTELIKYPQGKKNTEYMIPTSVTSISSQAFHQCDALTKVEIPNSVTNIGNETFARCSNLTSITIPNSVTSIGGYLFYKCSNLTNVIIGAKSIKDRYIFEGCDSLASVTISSSVTSINGEVFWYPAGLMNITVDKDNQNYCSENGVLFNKEKTELIRYPQGKKNTEYMIPNTVMNIENEALWCCSITSITIPNSVISIGIDVFYDPQKLTINTPCNSEYVISYAEENSITTALIHNWGEWQTIEEATFAKEGTKQRTCANDSSHIETETIAKLDKSLLEKHEAKAATCEEAGNNGYYSYNGKYYSDSEGTQEIQENSWVIEALGHEYGEATYTWNGDKTECTAERICTRDASHKETETAKTTNSVTKAATCEQAGERTYTATFTNEAFSQQTTTEEIKATGHKEGTPVEENRVESTCTQEGHYDEVIYCTVCNKEISRERKTIKAKGHTYSTEWTIDKEATCEETGEKSHHCTECGERTDITTIEALGHDYQIKSTTEAVCEKGGTIIYECTKCKATKQETIPATGHRKEIDAAVEPTCTEKGKTEGKHCSVCGKVLVAQEEIPAKGHTAGQPIEENRVESTCTQEGHYDEVIYCTECNTEISRERKTIKAKGHTYSTEWTIDKEATCEETGEKSHHCTECGERTDITTIEALGHDYQIKSTTDAVCEKGGTIIYECTRCKTTKEETTPALGHKGGTPVEENRVEATCTENGSYDEVTYCKVCGEKLLKEKKTIPALGHDYEKIVVQPTETEQGYTLHICKRCKDEYKDNYVPSIDKKDPIQIKDDEKDITIIEKEEQKYIIVEPNTTVDRLKEAIIIEKEYTVIDKENKQKEGILATGDKITVKDTYKTSYIIIVKGDVNEDGVIDFMGDVVMLNNYRLGLIKLSKEAILAGDMNMDGKIDFVEDVVKINNYRISAVRSLIK